MTPPRKCSIFYCDKKHGNLCCTDCTDNGSCKNRCLNAPDRCNCEKVAPTKAK